MLLLCRMKACELKISAVFLCLILSGIPLAAQFYNNGTDNASIRWKELQTPGYRIIYPNYADSLALLYAGTLEKYTPENLPFRKKLPVILHTENAVSNGSVGWAPSRMELYTVPDSYSPLSSLWTEQLCSHEFRHYFQMYPGYDRKFLAGRILFGELWPMAIGALYPSIAIMEGDAVAYETAVMANGRGRKASFLEYYRVCFANGDRRNFWQWRYGSNRKFTPDYYRAGYLQIAGPSALYNEPDLTRKYLDRIIEKPWLPINNFNKTIKEISGKNFKTVWSELTDSLSREWAEWERQRAPFREVKPVTGDLRRYTAYEGTTCMNGKLYAVRHGIERTGELVEIDSSGCVRRLHGFTSSYQGLKTDNIYKRLVWTETIGDARWEMKSYSVVNYYGADGQIHSLTRGTRYFQVCCCDREALYAVIEYPVRGGSNVVILNPADGSVISRTAAPSGFELSDLAWVGKKLFAVANTSSGAGIYNVSDGFTPLVENVQSSISELDPYLDKLSFVCDRTGVDELYCIDLSDKKILQLSNTRFGGSDWVYSSGKLYFSQPGKDGRNICLIHGTEDRNVTSLNYERVSFLVPDKSPELPVKNCDTTEYKIRNYSKLGHLLRFHSWVPLFIDANTIETMSLSSLTTSAGLGATAFFQNHLGSASGIISYHAQPVDGKWQHSGHLKFKYGGWYPVFELSADLNDRNSLDYKLEKITTDRYINYRITGEKTSRPLVAGTLSAYIPFSINSRGLTRGIVPQVKYSISNDLFLGANIPLQRLSLSLRGYLMKPIASSCIYPRYGVGLEVGNSFRPGLTELFSGDFYTYLYGYLPGIIRTHGIKLSAMLDSHTGDGIFAEPYLNTAPRGFTQSHVASQLASFDKQAKFSIDYAMPFGNADWSFLCPVAYIRNFELILHSDFTLFGDSDRTGALISTGADLQIVLGNFLWIPYTTRIGVSYNYNSGPSFNAFATEQGPLPRHHAGLLFSVDF